MNSLLLVCTPALLLIGCTTFSGLNGSSNYACKAPEGVACDSVSGTYANALHNNLPIQRAHAIAAAAAEGNRRVPSRETPLDKRVSLTSPGSATTGLAPTPVALRSAPRVLRLWFKPWEDADHDLYDQGYVYVQVDAGQWRIEHVQQQIRESYAPLKAPARSAGAGAGEPPSGPSRVAPRPAIGLPSRSAVQQPPGAPPGAVPLQRPRAPDESSE